MWRWAFYFFNFPLKLLDSSSSLLLSVSIPILLLWGMKGAVKWQIRNPFILSLHYCHASSFPPFCFNLPLIPLSRSLFLLFCFPSARHLHRLGGAGRHLAALRALGQGAGARAGAIHGVGGGEGGGARAGKAGHARWSHCGEAQGKWSLRVKQWKLFLLLTTITLKHQEKRKCGNVGLLMFSLNCFFSRVEWKTRIGCTGLSLLWISSNPHKKKRIHTGSTIHCTHTHLNLLISAADGSTISHLTRLYKLLISDYGWL